MQLYILNSFFTVILLLKEIAEHWARNNCFQYIIQVNLQLKMKTVVSKKGIIALFCRDRMNVSLNIIGYNIFYEVSMSV